MKRLDYYYPSLSGSWLLVALLLGGSLVFGLALGILKMIVPSPVLSSTTVTYLCSMVLPLLFIWLMATRGRREGVPAVALNQPAFGQLKGFPTFALAALAMLALTVVIDPLTTLIPMPERFKALFEMVFMNAGLGDTILATCILAPLCEELLCRGMIQRGIARTRSPRAAILWSAFIFALIHMNPWQAIPAFVLGVLFGWVYYRTGCLWLTIFLHCLNNSLSTLLSRLIPGMAIDTGFTDILSTENYIVLYVGAVALLAGAVWLLNKYLPKPEAR